MRTRYLLLFIAALLFACDSRTGSDSISSHPDYQGTAGACNAQCHSAQSTISPDPLRTNGTGTAGKHIIHVSSRNIDCEVCHNGYDHDPNHMNQTLDTGNPGIPIMNFNLAGPTGNWITTGVGTGTCTGVACHGPGAVMDWYGTATWTMPPCTTCHASGFSTALDPLVTNDDGTSGKHAKHVTDRHFACDKCHYNYPAINAHMNGTLDTVDPNVLLTRFDAANPQGAWISDIGQQTGSCSSLACHGPDMLAWYGTATWLTPASCAVCHGVVAGTRRQVLGTGGDFQKESHHVINYGSRSIEVVTPADCQVCHEMAEHMVGAVRLKHKDNAAQVIVYLPASPSSLEPFCLSCHDANGAAIDASPLSPFSDGNTLGTGLNVAGNKIAGYWNSAVTTHKTSGLTCAGTGAANTGCHGNNGMINMHGSATRGLLAQNMTYPIPPTAGFNENDYWLCFNCHSSSPAVTKEVVLGYRQGGNYDNPAAPTPYYTPGIQSLFRDRFIANPANYPTYWSGINQSYNNNFWYTSDTRLPLHNFHLLGSYFDPLVPSLQNWFSWKYRGDSSQVGRITCTSCHNVHGTTNTVRSTYDELFLTRGTGAGSDLYTGLSSTVAAPGVMTTNPLNCTADCHGNYGASTYWYAPADE